MGELLEENLRIIFIIRKGKWDTNMYILLLLVRLVYIRLSGHWDHYKENMFPVMKVDEEEFVLRPMNCPHHMLVYGNELHSYRDSPD